MEIFLKLEILSELLAHRRIPGEIKRSTRPIFDLNGMKQSSSKLLYIQEETSVEEVNLDDTLFDLKSMHLMIFFNFKFTDATKNVRHTARVTIFI
jgi:hypothetical protein